MKKKSMIKWYKWLEIQKIKMILVKMYRLEKKKSFVHIIKLL